MLEGPCCHPELRLSGHCLLWAWFDFVLLEAFHFQTESSPGNAGDRPELGGSAQQPLPYTMRWCCVTILGIHLAAPSPVLWDRLCLEASPAPALPSSGTDGRLCFLHVCHFSSNGMSKTLPYLTGWLTLNLFIESKGFFWISMMFYIQRITNMIADLV